MIDALVAYKVGISVISVIGDYILVRSMFSIIRLSIRIIFSLLSILFLTAIVSLIYFLSIHPPKVRRRTSHYFFKHPTEMMGILEA
ncbi:hypothetical protein SAMN05444362_106132 [Dysgonomonas macrotermitis]|uniref:Uncharacterized protein n=1 Tax=Dysgonomonas macrotermitis TaxID=1346286 RepID=A0A1M5BP21_9BACT|nr:hypothetical protein SAMN05444362_106132 [Dysgonomonas macrotermitis]